MTKKLSSREDAMKVARFLGCRGAHQRPDGNWVPCINEETLSRISNRAETVNVSKNKTKKKRKEPDGWENLEEGGIVGIHTLPNGSLVSAPISGKRTIFVQNANNLRFEVAKNDIYAKKLFAKAEATNTRSSSPLAANVEKSLTMKVKNHNKRMEELGKPDWSQANIGQLRSVFRRGVGAYKVSHRKNTTENQWAMARVNAFLKILATGKPTNLNYISDSDLLSDSHPWKNRYRRN